MRFRFCGDLDCPEWVLAEISTLSKVTSVKIKLLCLQVIKDLLDVGIDRFRFCGDLDCPEWVLAEISTLSKVTSVKIKLLCLQVIKDLLDVGIDVRCVIR